MEKKLIDYIHFYIGQPCVNSWFAETHDMYDNGWILAGVDKMSAKPYKLDNSDDFTWSKEVLVILRPLSDMTEEEAIALYCSEPWHHVSKSYIKQAVIKENVKGHQPNIIEIDHAGPSGSSGYCMGTDLLYLNKLSARQFAFLLSRGFDLFGLIESGLALDKTKREGNV